MNLFDSTFLATAATWCAVFVAIWAVISQNRNNQRLARQQLFLQIYAQWESADVQIRRGRLAEQLLKNRDAVEIDDMIVVFLENLSLMIRKNMLEQELTWNVFSIDLVSYWVALQPYIFHVRSEENDVTLFEEFETLASKWNSASNQRLGAESSNIAATDESIVRFLQWEVRRCRNSQG